MFYIHTCQIIEYKHSRMILKRRGVGYKIYTLIVTTGGKKIFFVVDMFGYLRRVKRLN